MPEAPSAEAVSREARALSELSASIAHEIRNPITAAKSLVQQIRESPAAPENAEYARVAVEELDRVERSISHLLRYAREEKRNVVYLEPHRTNTMSSSSSRVGNTHILTTITPGHTLDQSPPG